MGSDYEYPTFVKVYGECSKRVNAYKVKNSLKYILQTKTSDNMQIYIPNPALRAHTEPLKQQGHRYVAAEKMPNPKQGQ